MRQSHLLSSAGPAAPCRPRRRRRPSAHLPGVLLIALAAVACTEELPPGDEATAADDRPQRGGQAVVALSADIQGVNSLIGPTNRPTEAIMRHVFLQLVKENADFESGPPTFRPDLAESWEWSEDPLAITFRLRDDAVWTDGHPVTAEDVRFTWQAQTHPDIAWDTAYYKGSITDVEVIDPHTVRYHLEQRNPAQLMELNEGYILPAHKWGQVPFSEWRASGQWFVDNAVYAGPFRIAKWTPQQEIVLERNESYYDPELPYLDRVVFRVIPESTNRLTQLLSGEVDFVTQISSESAQRVEDDPDLRVVEFWGPSFMYVGWNVAQPPLDDPDVRLALTLGIDRQTVVDNVWGRYGRVAHSPVLQGVWAYNRSLEPHPYDPRRARELLAAAGWSDSDGDGLVDRGGRNLSIELMTNADNRQRADAAVLIQSQLERIGVDVETRLIEFQSLIEQIYGHDFEAFIGAWTMPTGLDYRFAFHSGEIGNGGSNVGSYRNAEVDRLLDEIRGRPDLAAAKPQILRLQELLHRELPYTFLWESKRLVGVSRRLRDVEPNVLYVHDNLPHWWVESAD